MPAPSQAVRARRRGVRPRRRPGGRARATARPSGPALPAPARPRGAPGRLEPPPAAPRGPAGDRAAGATTSPRAAGRRRPHHGRDARRLRAGAGCGRLSCEVVAADLHAHAVTQRAASPRRLRAGATAYDHRVPVDTSWSFAPVVLLVARGLRGRVRPALAHVAPPGRRACGRVGPGGAVGGGAATLFVALISPLDTLGEQFATFHMVQHLLIADLVADRLTLALTKWILRPATQADPRRSSAGPGRSGIRRSGSSPTSA